MRLFQILPSQTFGKLRIIKFENYFILHISYHHDHTCVSNYVMLKYPIANIHISRRQYEEGRQYDEQSVKISILTINKSYVFIPIVTTIGSPMKCPSSFFIRLATQEFNNVAHWMTTADNMKL